ncbi:hypothetical protein, partial [Oleiphilus sp. HI0117]
MPGLVKKTITVLVAASASIANATIDLSGLPGEFPHQEEVCASDLAREALRAESASQALNTPFIDMIKV